MRLRWTSGRSLRILDFDTECRPMHYSEFRAESQMTGIAWSWVGSDQVHCVVLNQDLSNERAMLEAFMADFNRADIVTGHYIRKHDLPLLVDHCVRLDVPLPKSLLTQDTMDTVSVKGLGKSQENLATTFALDAEKHHMTGASWRVANTLSRDGKAGTRKRVVDDVKQHKELRRALLDRGLLRSPKLWHP
jgi:hypothetical protein